MDRGSPSYGSITTTTKPGWRNVDVARRIEAELGLPANFDTDVNGAALAEMSWGAGRGLSDFAYVTVGTGIGVGLIANGTPVHGFGHPELGHVRVKRLPGDDWPGACPFHGDCVEGIASGSALKARLGGGDPGGLAADDPVWASVADALAQLCHGLVCATAPQQIAIGGGVIERQPHLLGKVRERLVESLAGYVPLPGEDYLVLPELGAQAGPLGAVALAIRAAA